LQHLSPGVKQFVLGGSSRGGGLSKAGGGEGAGRGEVAELRRCWGKSQLEKWGERAGKHTSN